MGNKQPRCIAKWIHWGCYDYPGRLTLAESLQLNSQFLAAV